MTSTPLHMTHLFAVTGDERDDELLVPWSAALAAALHLPLTLLRVVEPDGDDVALRAAVAADTLAIMAGDRRLSRHAVETRVEVGPLAAVLPAVGASASGSLLILVEPRQAGGAGREAFHALLDALTTPFVVIPPNAEAPAQIQRIIVGNDRSSLAERVLRTAQTVGHALGVDVVGVEAVEPGTVGDAEFASLAPELAARTVRARGRASRVLLRVARARDAAIIVVGSHGIGEGQRSLAGSTTEWLIANADRPVLVVPDPSRQAGQGGDDRDPGPSDRNG